MGNIKRRHVLVAMLAAASASGCAVAVLGGTLLAGASTAPRASKTTAELYMETTGPTLGGPSAGAQKLLSYSWGASSEVSIGSATGGAGAGKINEQDLSVQFAVSQASPQLLPKMGFGAHFATLSVVLAKPGSIQTFELSNAFIASVSVGATGGKAPSSTEAVTIAYEAIQQTYVPVSAKGVAGTPAVGAWNFIDNNPTFP
jgi:type VI secretion system secreted protein Hcp